MTSDWKPETWQGDGVSVEVLYSRAGVAIKRKDKALLKSLEDIPKTALVKKLVPL